MGAETVVAKVQEFMGELTGIRFHPDNPPESPLVLPMSVCYVGPSRWHAAGAPLTYTGLYTITIEIHIPRKDLPRDAEVAYDYIDAVPNKLYYEFYNNNNCWDGTIQTFEGIETDGFQSWTWDKGLITVGYKFRVTGVKVQSTATA